MNVQAPTGAFSEDFSKYCKSVTLPGTGFTTTTYRYHGPKTSVAIVEQYQGGVTLTFYADAKGKIYDYFYQWLMKIGGDKFYIPFYEEYKGEMVVQCYDQQDKPVYKISVAECYPVNISDYGFAYSGGRVSTFDVTMTCHHTEFSIKGG